MNTVLSSNKNKYFDNVIDEPKMTFHAYLCISLCDINSNIVMSIILNIKQNQLATRNFIF